MVDGMRRPLRQATKRRGVVIVPHPSFEWNATVLWQPERSDTRYPIPVQRIFPRTAYDSVYKYALEGKPLSFQRFAYIPWEEVYSKLSKREREEGRFVQFKDDAKKLLWLGE